MVQQALAYSPKESLNLGNRYTGIMKKNIKNIKSIPDTADFYDLFDINGNDAKHEDSFEELFKKSEKDPELKKIQGQKSDNFKTIPVSIKERIKSYPQPQRKYDLHGLTGSEAEIITEKFLNESTMSGLKTVRVITGKGHHSSAGSVLRDRIETLANILKKNKKILGWNWEKKYKEKSGSMIFYLN